MVIMTPQTAVEAVTELPVVIDGVTCERDAVVAMCTDVLVDAALNEGGDPFDPDPQWLGPARNAEGFRLGEESLRVVLGPDDLAQVISRAEEELQRQFGYVPRGRQRTITFEYHEREFDVTANAAMDGKWRLEIFEFEPPDPEFAAIDGRIGRGWSLSGNELFNTPGDAIGTGVSIVIDKVDDDDAEAERRAKIGRPKR